MKFFMKRGKNVTGRRIYIGSDRWECHRRIYDHIVRFSRKKRISFLKEPSLKATSEVRKMISDLENFKEAGLVHIMALSKAVKRKIRIKNLNNNVDVTIGRSGSPINLRLEENHFKNETHLNVIPKGKNCCLFDAVAAETGLLMSSEEIRVKTLKEFEKNKLELAIVVDKISSIPNWKEALDLMSGGARYSGRSASDAGRVIDDSQNGRCHPRGLKGHPRGHASHPGASGSDDSVENFSRGGWKTGFLSRNDQNLVGNLTFNTDEAQRAMERLNRGSDNEAIHLSVRELGKDDLPMASEFRNGSASGSPQRMQRVTVVMRHFQGEQNNSNYNVFIHTFYPRL